MRRRWWTLSVVLAAVGVLLAFWSGTWKRADRETQERVSRADGNEPSSREETVADKIAGAPGDSDSGTSFVVVNDFGEPLPDAVAEHSEGVRFQADEHGCIRLGEMPWGVLLVWAPNHTAGEIFADDTRVVLARSYEAAGRVVDSAGVPMAFVELLVAPAVGTTRWDPRLRVNARGERAIPTKTDEQGRFAVSGVAARGLNISVSGHVVLPPRAIWAGEDGIEVVALKLSSVQLEIAAEGGEIPPDTFFKHVRPGAWGGDRNYTEPQRFKGLKPGVHKFYAHTEGGLEAESVVTLAEGEHRTVRLTLRAVPKAIKQSHVAIRLLDSDAQLMTGVSVGNRFQGIKKTDQEGVAGFRFELAPGSETYFQFYVWHPKTKMRTKKTISAPTFPLGEKAEPVDVSMGLPVKLELEIVDPDGHVVENVKVRLPTDARKAGALSWYVSARSRTRVVFNRFREVELAPGKHRIVLHPATAITGRLIDEAGKPVDIASGAKAWDDNDGEVVLEPTDAPGEFRIELSFSHFQRVFFRRQARSRIPEADVAVDFLPHSNLAMGDVVLRKSRSIIGRVLGPDNKPLGGAQVVALPDFDARSWSQTVTHSDGRFSMNLAAMVTHVVVRKFGFGTSLVRVADTEQVVLPRPGVLDIDYGGSWRIGWPQHDGEVVWSGQQSGMSDEPAEFGPGRYLVRPRGGGEDMIRDVFVEEGKTTRVKSWD